MRSKIAAPGADHVTANLLVHVRKHNPWSRSKLRFLPVSLVWGLGFRFFGFRVLGFRVQGFVWGLGFRFLGLEFLGLGFKGLFWV